MSLATGTRMPMVMVLLLVVATSAAAAATNSTSRVDVRRGERFPDLRFEQLVDPEDYANLGLPRRQGAFSLSEIAADLLVVEFMNKHCIPCQKQVRRVQSLYDELRRQGQFPAVRVLAVAAGNQAKYLPKFREKRGLTFPIAADARLEQWRRFGEPGRTPLSLFLTRDGDQWILREYHFGVREEGWLLAETLEVMGGTGGTSGADPLPATPQGQPVTLDRLGERAAAGKLLARVLGRPVQPEALELPDGSRLYRVEEDGGGALFARMASLEPLCEICHGVHFLYAFDDSGRVRGFEGLHVTKWGNEPWSPEDVRFFESRLVGRSFAGLEFDEELDAVSSATISSTIMFLEISEAGGLLEAARALP